MADLISATATGKSVAATAAALTAVVLPAGDGKTVRVVNEGPNICFIALGASTVAATLPTTGAGTKTCCAVVPGTDVVFERNPAVDTHISTICRASGTATLSVYVGEGE